MESRWCVLQKVKIHWKLGENRKALARIAIKAERFERISLGFFVHGECKGNS